ncbi:ion transporter [Zwartia sp.]|uniref:ion transporter n=1 Tax=Zwartia sp. TaxID=2978004 RepID=UPI00272318B0|nr:ion transporter [Zwartia sp.]MDO9026054.1 ion transporter [Zwartia sp.]
MTRSQHTLKDRMYTLIFTNETAAGRLFDKSLIALILLSLVIVILDSVEQIARNYHSLLFALEWVFTIIFSLEYASRLYCAKDRRKYATSFFGVIDLLAVLPTYLALFFPELHALIDVRVLRLIRIFRVFKLTAYMQEYSHLANALSASRKKILVFLSFVLMIVLVMGTLMYVVEGPVHGFTSIPIATYWAITTMTTVGFGDLTPQTDIGKLIASIMMLMGWGTLAVPTGIVTAEMSRTRGRRRFNQVACIECGADHLDKQDHYCRDCGTKL